MGLRWDFGVKQVGENQVSQEFETQIIAEAA